MNVAQVFNPRIVIALIAAGVVAFGAMLLLMAYGGNMGSSRDGRTHALSAAATGYKALVSLAGEFNETRLVRKVEEEGEDLLVVSLEPFSDPERVATLIARRSERPTLFILPKWFTMPDAERRGWVRRIGPGAGSMASGAFRGVTVEVGRDRPAATEAAGEGALSGIQFPVPAAPQTIAGKDISPLVELPGRGALIAQLGAAPHYVVADPDLVNNHGLRDPRRAAAALAMLARLNDNRETLAFDLTMNGFGTGNSKSLLRLAFEPPFVAMTLALFIAALLAGLHGAFRFGPPRREARAIAFGKAALVENSAGLIRLADREARLGGAYVDVVRDETARLTGAPYWLQGERLDRYLDRLSKAGRPSFSDLADQIRAERDRRGLLAAARALADWKKEIIR